MQTLQPATPAVPPAEPLRPTPPAPALPPEAGPVTVTAAPEAFVVGIPRTAREVSALRARRAELSNQLESAANRRGSLAQRLRQDNVTGADRAGLEQRLRVLDDRIVQLESDIAVTGRQLTAADPILLTSQSIEQRFRGNPVRGPAIAASFLSFLVFVPLAFAAARLMWRRANRPWQPAARPANDERMARLETAVDAIAIEVERIAEGQRFVTRLLAESNGVAPAFSRAQEPAVPVAATADPYDARRPGR